LVIGDKLTLGIDVLIIIVVEISILGVVIRILVEIGTVIVLAVLVKI
jgi:hypothetical protein